jgi:hypothetical protein
MNTRLMEVARPTVTACSFMPLIHPSGSDGYLRARQEVSL